MESSRSTTWLTEPGNSQEEDRLLNAPLPNELSAVEFEQTWNAYQAIIGKLLVRMGTEHHMLDTLARVPLVGSVDDVYARLALIPRLGGSAWQAYGRHGLVESVYRLAGECCLMELSAAAGYRTFCLPDLIRGLLKTGKMKERPVRRMLDTFEFLKAMFIYPSNDRRVLEQLNRTNELHARYKVAGAKSEAARNLFKYIALNMFYLGPSMRPDLTPEERHAICGLTVLVARRMGHAIDSSVKQLEAFIVDYENTMMFSPDDHSQLRKRAIEIAHASRSALYNFPTISPARIHGYVPYRVKKILAL